MCGAVRARITNGRTDRHACLTGRIMDVRSLRACQIDEVQDSLSADDCISVSRQCRSIIFDYTLITLLRHRLNGKAIESVTPAALVVHLRGCVAPVHFAEFE